MLSVLVSSVVDRVKQKTVNKVCVASPINMQDLGERTKTGWPGMSNMPVGLVQNGPHHHLIEN